jgi:hypothetical protein
VGVKTLEDGAVGEYMQNNLNPIQTALSGGAVVNQGVDYCEVLCNLKKLFRQHLKEYPAEFTCDLLCQVDCIECPKQDSQTFGADMETAYTSLLNLIFRYGVEHAMGKLVFDCCEPQDPDCVVLGAVYVENGVLRRVCNTPRQYVMTFNNIWKVLYFELIQKALARLAERQNRGQEPKCCPVFTFDGEMLGARVAYSRKAMSESIGAFPSAIGAFVDAAARSFNFADAANFAIKQVDPAKLHELKFSVRDEGVLDASRADFMARDLIASFMSKAMVQPSDAVVSYSIPNEKQSVFMRDVAAAIGAVEPGQSATGDAMQSLSKRLAEREAQIDQLTASLVDVNKRLDALSKGPKGRKGTDE